MLLAGCELGSEESSTSTGSPSSLPESRKAFSVLCAISSGKSLGEIFLLSPLNVVSLNPATPIPFYRLMNVMHQNKKISQH